MTGQQLKNAILALAVQGKLVPQNSTDEPASALLKRIAAEKARLVAEGKIKKEKPLPEITDEEKPFKIPAGWEWARLGKLINLVSGQDFEPEKYSDIDDTGTPYLTGASSLTDEGVILSRWTHEPKCIAEYGDLLLVCKGSGYGKTIICNIEIAHIARQIMAVKKSAFIDMRYIQIFLQCNLSVIKQQGQGVIPGISRNTVLQMPFPLPPLAEQKRIVSKIEELLPLVSAYDEVEQKLASLDADFPDKLKKSILQQAVQGKLAKQDKNDGPASELLKRIKAEKERLLAEGKIKKEKPLPPIKEEEKPFALPEGWEWVRLGEICRKIGSGNTPKGGRSSDVYKTTGVPLLREQNVYDDGLRYEGIVYISEELSQTRQGSKVFAKDLLLNITGGSMGRCAIVPDDFQIGDINQHILIIRLIEPELREYIHTFICSPLGQSIINTKAVGARAGFSAEKCKNMVVPLPPMEDQRRVGKYVKEKLVMCDKLHSCIKYIGERC